MHIYKITNNINGDFYIGKTIKTLEQRMWKHVYLTSKGSKTKLHNAMRKYGSENFSIISISSNISEENLNREEIRFIFELNPHYNMTSGGDGGNTSNSVNYKKNHKKSCLRGENHTRYGLPKHLSPVFGSKRSDESKIKMSESHLQIRQSRRKICEHCNKDVDFANFF